MRAAGGAVHAVDEVIDQQGRQRLRRHAPARPSRRDRAADGLLPVQQRRDRGAPCAEAARRSSASRSSISTCITATARRRSSGPTRRVMYCSTHQMPLYPGTGAASERGEHDTIVNAPLRAGDGGEEFREAFESAILPRLADFAAGPGRHLGRLRRAHARPAGQPQLVEADFAWVDAASSWRSPTHSAERPRRLGAGRRLRPARASPTRPPPM